MQSLGSAACSLLAECVIHFTPYADAVTCLAFEQGTWPTSFLQENPRALYHWRPCLEVKRRLCAVTPYLTPLYVMLESRQDQLGGVYSLEVR